MGRLCILHCLNMTCGVAIIIFTKVVYNTYRINKKQHRTKLENNHLLRAPSSRAAALLRGGSSRSWRRLPLGRHFRSPRIRAARAEGGREKLRRQLEPGGQRGGPWPHRPHWIHPSCGWSWHPVDAAPQWAAAPRLRRLQMLQRPGGIKHVREAATRGFLAKVVRRHYLY